MATETPQLSKVLEMLHQLKPLLVETYGVTRLGIFGSVARDRSKEVSDVDIVVEMAPDLFTMVHLKEHLQSVLQVPVDIVRYRPTMNPVLKQRIERDVIYV
ncbi:nucleotidyltransferase family protein [Phormidium tenue]|uniref:Polymerase beta nucleotidyltransferase domain-containing protein n=1 Tax=Phormidium tenue NIES-30 TaxID=549789 RepID=A0A1U7J460_9CYAN|nr:nucleotidyltransferase family protein [Phormidium tenue]MBD2233034.1 nucleotidyltransferase family protein [Phormidium tenue FACHB-1052]OKH47149.1 hypothetical protein NIES30_14320 [Phormidium tenue NIES-30]